MVKKVDVTYVVASKLGTIGMGSTAYHALGGIEKSNLTYKAFCRGYTKNVKLNNSNLTDYSFLEYLSYPFRFAEKFLKIKINAFRLVNWLFGKFVLWNLPQSKIHHTWAGIAPEAAIKAKKNGAILIWEGANSHPATAYKILKKEYDKYEMSALYSSQEEALSHTEMAKLANYVMCPSDFVYESFLENGFSKKQLIKLPYGVDLEKFQDFKKKKIDDKFRLVFVGSIQLRKGIQYLLQAWEELNLKNAELIIVGRVWPDAEKIVAKYRNDPTIKFVGFDSDPKKYLQEADVFVSPSLEEGSALTCYEAMACQLPLIATFNTGSVARDKKDGFIVPPANVNALKNKIKYFYDNPSKVIEMGKNAKKNVENFSWEIYGKKVLEVYKKLISK